MNGPTGVEFFPTSASKCKASIDGKLTTDCDWTSCGSKPFITIDKILMRNRIWTCNSHGSEHGAFQPAFHTELEQQRAMPYDKRGVLQPILQLQKQWHTAKLLGKVIRDAIEAKSFPTAVLSSTEDQAWLGGEQFDKQDPTSRAVVFDHLAAAWPLPDPLDELTERQKEDAAAFLAVDFTYHVKTLVKVADGMFVNACIGTCVSAKLPHYCVNAKLLPQGEGSAAISRLLAAPHPTGPVNESKASTLTISRRCARVCAMP